MRIERVTRMVRSMQHRGPDDEGIWAPPIQSDGSRWVGILGGCRLAIQDLTPAGHQPMVDPATGAGIVFNGEIYNFRDLRRQLLEDGVTLRSHSDTEVVLQLLLRQGSSALQLLEGMYALAMWHPVTGQLFMARDRLGVKPLYFSETNGVVAFASELRALLAAGVSNRLSPAGVDSFLRFGAPREPDTILEDVHQLPAGSWLTKSASGTVAGTSWDTPTGLRHGRGAEESMSFPEAASHVRDLLFESVRLRLVSDVPVVTFLSGGLDSSCVVAAVRHVTGASPATIGVTFKEQAYSEAKAIRTLVDHFECRHVNYELSDAALRDLIPRAVRSMDQPTIDGINTFVVSKVAAERGFKVALSGLGGDELFGGYRSFRAVPLLNATKRMLGGRLGRALAAVISLALPAGERRKKMRQWFLAPRLEGDAYDLVRELFSMEERRALVRRTTSSTTHRNDGVSSKLSFSDISWRELSEYMRNILLRDTDCFAMACSLEVREPYLHAPLVEFMLGLPDRLKARKPNKALLRQAFAALLPASTLRMPKHGFVLPFGVWLRGGPLHDDAERLLMQADSSGLLEQTEVRSIWTDFQGGRTSWNRVWALYVLRQWCAQHLTV